MKKSAIAIISASFILLWSACKKEEKIVDPPAPDNEVITTVRLIAVNAADATDVDTAQWRDLTPNDGNPDLSQANLKLKAGAVYNMSLTFLDETKNPAEDITEEIHERSIYHLICYEPSSGLGITVQRTDYDDNTPKLELGLQAKATTTSAASGTLQVSLHHQPSGKNGTDCAIGSTDAEVTFNVTVE